MDVKVQLIFQVHFVRDQVISGVPVKINRPYFDRMVMYALNCMGFEYQVNFGKFKHYILVLLSMDSSLYLWNKK